MKKTWFVRFVRWSWQKVQNVRKKTWERIRKEKLETYSSVRLYKWTRSKVRNGSKWIWPKIQNIRKRVGGFRSLLVSLLVFIPGIGIALWFSYGSVIQPIFSGPKTVTKTDIFTLTNIFRPGIIVLLLALSVGCSIATWLLKKKFPKISIYITRAFKITIALTVAYLLLKLQVAYLSKLEWQVVNFLSNYTELVWIAVVISALALAIIVWNWVLSAKMFDLSFDIPIELGSDIFGVSKHLLPILLTFALINSIFWFIYPQDWEFAALSGSLESVFFWGAQALGILLVALAYSKTRSWLKYSLLPIASSVAFVVAILPTYIAPGELPEVWDQMIEERAQAAAEAEVKEVSVAEQLPPKYYVLTINVPMELLGTLSERAEYSFLVEIVQNDYERLHIVTWDDQRFGKGRGIIVGDHVFDRQSSDPSSALTYPSEINYGRYFRKYPTHEGEFYLKPVEALVDGGWLWKGGYRSEKTREKIGERWVSMTMRPALPGEVHIR